MFFYVSKIAWFVLQPSSLVMLAALLALVRRRRGTAVAVVLLMGAIGISPAGHLVVLPLEERFARPADLAAAGPFAGIIVLGGAEDGRISRTRAELSLNEAAERITETVVLARRLPGVRVIFTGGPGELLYDMTGGAEAVQAYLTAAGLEPSRLTIEKASRTTYENAILTRDLVAPKPGQKWLLVTSAFHMPRSVGCFRAAGFDVIPWPVDYRTAGEGDLWRLFDSVPDGWRRIDMAAREWVGLLAYRASGRTSALFPAP